MSYLGFWKECKHYHEKTEEGHRQRIHFRTTETLAAIQ
jgi:hypothetical protein